ncbi:hypothetical protein ACQR3W_21760 [Rhodococcus ruber]|uniref:Uncharacterized protein n=1 Tax=Rhodococcus ruber TaxID=1830 RepID=A0A098BJQ4_9NOCA|nr:hypothetical protein [Rhodococcus ruber]MCZ4506400.1 hypothetical protein [Rhodococcus ruber]MCZ4533358.1 hypothetical protein [Rhodococcus ruber]MCZ4533391.1 hypothetical protein [Rhodococcus ruber]CDZ88984.1 hypothetical protein RHRU231_450151 [Rhodococcus ruber]
MSWFSKDSTTVNVITPTPQPYQVVVLRLAAHMRIEAYPGAELLDWKDLTDAQKVPWILKADKRMQENGYES